MKGFHLPKLDVTSGFTSRLSRGAGTRQWKPHTDKRRCYNLLRRGVHLTPAAACLVLVVINCRQYYIGGELAGPVEQDTERFGGLLFAAKLHEFLMLVSLGIIIHSYCSQGRIYGNSEDFRLSHVFSTIPHQWKLVNKRRKAVLSLMVIICTLLGATVGLSSMALMRPRLNTWPAGGTSFYLNTTSDTISPLIMQDSPSLMDCAFDTGDPACPYGDWQLIQQEYHAFWPRLSPMGSMPVHIDIPSPFSLRSMKIFQRASSDQWKMNLGSIWGGHFSLATIPTAPIADGLAEAARLWARAVAVTKYNRFQWREDVQFVTRAPQTMVYVRCSENIVDITHLEDLRISFPILNAIQFEDGNTFDGTVEQIGFYADNSSDTNTNIKSLFAAGTPPALTWMDQNDLLAKTNSTLLAIATFPDTTAGTSNIYTCSIDSRLTQTEVITSRNEYKLVSGTPPNWNNGTVASSWPRTVPTAAWAKYMNPTIKGTNSSAFSSITSTAGIWNTSLVAEPYNFAIIVEGILTTMVANGMARSSYNTSMITTLKGDGGDGNQWYATGWFRYFFAKSSIFNVSSEEQAASTKYDMSASVIGYAYSYKGATQQAAIASLLTYIILVALHSTLLT